MYIDICIFVKHFALFCVASASVEREPKENEMELHVGIHMHSK